MRVFKDGILEPFSIKQYMNRLLYAFWYCFSAYLFKYFTEDGVRGTCGTITPTVSFPDFVNGKLIGKTLRDGNFRA